MRHTSRSSNARRALSRCGQFLVGVAICLCVAGCSAPLPYAAVPGDAAPVVKIALIASFEGLERPVGYAVLPAVRESIAEANARGDLGPYRVALVALNDDLDPEAAAAQARAAALDADVLAVVGLFNSGVAEAAVPMLVRAGVPAVAAAPLGAPGVGVVSLCPAPGPVGIQNECFIRVGIGLSTQPTPHTQTTQPDYAICPYGTAVFPPDGFRPWLASRMGAAAEGILAAACVPEGMVAPVTAAGEEDVSLTHAAALARLATQLVLRALADDIAAHGRPTRAGVMAALARRPISVGFAWYRIEDGRWVPVR